jgi:hypothetical protein
VSTSGLSETVKSFIIDHINSVEQLEVLLLLHRHWQKDWSAEEISKELRIDPHSAAERLEDLCHREFLSKKKDCPSLFRYNPRQSNHDRAVSELADAYTRHRVTIITQIFSKPLDKIRSFSDAFKFYK